MQRNKELSVFIVEDEPWALKMLREFISKRKELTLCGFATNGLDALEMLNKNKYHCVFLDLNLPKLDGISILKQISGNTVVIITTVRKDRALEAYQDGAIDYVLKPFDEERFNEAVDRAIQYINGDERIYKTNKIDNEIESMEIFFQVLQDKYLLTYQETAICKYIQSGKTRNEILSLCGIGGETLKSHLRKIYSKTIERESDVVSDKSGKFHRLIIFLNSLIKEIQNNSEHNPYD